MEAASRGASEAGGTVIGVLRHSRRPTPTLTSPTRSPPESARPETSRWSLPGEAVIAVGGEWGTLSEIAYARKIGRPVVAIRSWTLRNRAGTDLGIVEAETPEQAVERGTLRRRRLLAIARP